MIGDPNIDLDQVHCQAKDGATVLAGLFSIGRTLSIVRLCGRGRCLRALREDSRHAHAHDEKKNNETFHQKCTRISKSMLRIGRAPFTRPKSTEPKTVESPA